MVELPTLREMIDAGVHFGHKTSRWSPKMAPYIFMSKNGVHVINLEKTAEKLKEALDFVQKEAEAGKTFVFVGTKKQSQAIIKETALAAGAGYVNLRWLGGTLTNFDAIKAAIGKFKSQRELLESSNSEMTKSELSRIRKEVARGEKFLGGLTEMNRKPDVLIVFDAHDEKNALKEAKIEKIPVVAITDTNADPTSVEYPIPANDDATKSIEMMANLFAKTIAESKAKSVKVEANSKKEDK